jgi:hypothetical protein
MERGDPNPQWDRDEMISWEKVIRYCAGIICRSIGDGRRWECDELDTETQGQIDAYWALYRSGLPWTPENFERFGVDINAHITLCINAGRAEREEVLGFYVMEPEDTEEANYAYPALRFRSDFARSRPAATDLEST